MLTERMRRVSSTTAALVGTLAATAAAVAMAGAGDAGARSAALVRVVECSRGPEALDRHATFRAAMRRLPHTERMWMRFTLQERVGDGRFRTVRAPGLGRWRKSLPAVRRFSHRQRVLELAEGSAYRTVVGFRWYDGEGQLIRRTRRRSKPCDQPGRLPNLAPLQIGGGQPLAGAPGSARYTVRIVNRGRRTAPRFGVSLAVDGHKVDTQSVAALAPGHVRQLVFAGPVCSGSLTARVDPGDAVREVSERDNVLTAPCPQRN